MSLERLSLLVVDDSSFVRMMMAEILRALKVGRVVLASDGSEAIGILKQATKNKAAAGVLSFDIILSDFVMSPINGAMLLRWVRQHEESPDRFVPFVMVSGAADSDKVRESRDLGVTEFLAKPFSVKSVAEHILAAIDAPRQFVFSSDYFGPDRRRQKRPWNGKERRIISADQIEVVHSGSRLKGSTNKGAKVFIFKLPNRLREKIAGIGKSGPLELDIELLKEAEQQLDRMESDYADWVRGSLKQLMDLYDVLVVADDMRKRANVVANINRLAHDLRGQGSTFGYPLITVFGRSLHDCTANVADVTAQLIEFIKAHLDGINAVIREKVKGSGGTMGNDLVASLETAREKLTTSS